MVNKTIVFSDLDSLYIDNGTLTIRRYQHDDFAKLNQQFDLSNFEWYTVKYNAYDDFINKQLKKYQQQESVTYVIIENSTQNIVGTSSVYDMNLNNKALTIGYTWFGKMYQGKFYNAMSKLLILNYLFTTLCFNRVQLNTDILNLKSQNAMCKLGFVKEGILRKHIVTHTGRARDTVVFSIIVEEWLETKKIIQKRIEDKLSNI